MATAQTNNPWFAATIGLIGLIVGFTLASASGGGFNIGGGSPTPSANAGATGTVPSRYSSAVEAFTAYAADIGIDEGDFESCLTGGSQTAEVQGDLAAGSAAGIDGTPGFWILGPNNIAKKVSGAFPYDTFKQTFDAMLAEDSSLTSDAGTPPSVDDDPFKGDENAPITVIEFTDYQCPFCSRHFTQTFGSIEQDYIDTGKVKYVLRDYPLSFHPNAQISAEAANCAGEQGKYWEMHDELFANQTEWSGLAK